MGLVVRLIVPAAAVLLGLLAVQSRPAAAPPAGSPLSPTFEDTVQPFLAKHCVACHSARKKKGNLDLERFDTEASLATDPDTWDHVLSKLRTGEMPPEEDPRPHPAALEAVAGWIERRIARADRETPADPGRVTIRRLNRTEYDNTIRDLLAVDLRPAEDFPQDDSGYGFDNIGDVLSLPPVLMERYLAAAERATRTALFGPGRLQPTLTRRQMRSRTVEPSPEVPATYDTTGLSLPNALHVVHRFPVDGEYVIRVAMGGTRPLGSAPVQVALWIDGAETAAATVAPDPIASFTEHRQDFMGKHVEFRVRATAGDRWLAVAIPRLFEGLPSDYSGPRPSIEVVAPRVFTPPPGASDQRIARLRAEFEKQSAERAPANEVRVAHLDVGGPYAYREGPSPESLRRIYTCGHVAGAHGPACARRIVSTFARRAWRRPVDPAEVNGLLVLVDAARARGESLEEGLAVALQAVLVTPDFLFRLERTEPVPVRPGVWRIDQHALAARLSYFLWASQPDARLRRLAGAGALRTPAVLEREVVRMLRDPRARSLVEEFGGQWLQVRALESAAPDRERFPGFDDYLRLSMRRETDLLFETIVREDRSILEFLTADYTFANERLARHYGMAGVSGPAFRRVSLAGTKRGGVLTHGSVLTVSSYATRTSPVLRGKWILENLLDAPPPDPPPGVPNLDEVKLGDSATVRQQLEAHRADPTCASCHRRMDPLGFGLEHYDAIGAWRAADAGAPIDASGTLPDGRAFSGSVELGGILALEREAFARALTSKLLTYALGRGLERYDRQTVRNIARALPAHEYRFSRLVYEIVASAPFQLRRGATP